MTIRDRAIDSERSRLSATTLIVVLLLIAFIGYRVWPLYSLADLARAVQARNVSAAMSHVDVPAVRRSIITQIIDTHLKQKIRSPLQRGIVVGVATAVVDPVFADLVSPDALTDFLHGGWPTAIPDRPASIPSGTSVVNSANLGSAWRTYMNADFGIRDLKIDVPASLPTDRRFGLEFRLINWRWRLVSIQLPEELRVRLAELVTKRRAGAKSGRQQN
jgi:hypothetical protein